MKRKICGRESGHVKKTTITATLVAGMVAMLLVGCDEMAKSEVVPVISIADTRTPEFDNGATKAEFAVMLKPASGQDVTVGYTTVDGTAVAGRDYAETSGTLTFSPGETMKKIEVAIKDDTLVEPYETLTVTLSNPTNATLADATAVGTVTNDDTKIYFTYDGSEQGAPIKILRADLDGFSVEELVTSGQSCARGIALDIAGGIDKVYWTDCKGRIRRANLDGSKVEEVVNRWPWKIALDGTGGKMYWSEGGSIWRANLNGTDVEELVSGLSIPIGIALDLAGDKMYWAERGGDNLTGKIKRAKLDGSDIETLIVSGNPAAIALDVTGGKMYWTDDVPPPAKDTIQRANLDGTDVEELVTEGLDGPLGIALDVAEGKMYWAAYWTGKIQRANLDGSRVEDLVTEPRSFPNGIALALR